jgi:anti-sigma B factor antagonist
MGTGEAPVVVYLDGEVDLGSADAVCERLAIAGRLTDDIVIDLRDVTFIDSTGVGVLATAVRRGAEIELREASPAVQRAITLSGLVDPIDT